MSHALRAAVGPFLLLLALVAAPPADAQGREVTGTVVEAETGLPVPSVNIRVEGTLSGTASGVDGTYRIDVRNADAVLVFSAIGYVTQEVAVGGQRRVDVALATDDGALDDVVVTATRQPVRRLEATQAIDVVGPKQFEVTRPEGIAEAVTGTPGVFTSSNQGRMRGSVFIRGFPDGEGNGLVYTGILLDGLPTGGTTARPPDFAFGYDLGVERVEVVRGGSATLFGRSSAAGALNVITKTGGATHDGTARVTYYNPNFDGSDALNLRLDANVNGPLSPTLRYNASGFLLQDDGYRDFGYGDRGFQGRANVDWLSPTDGSSVRLYGLATNVTIQNMIDIPYRLDTMTPADGWDVTDSFYTPILDEIDITAVTPNYDDPSAAGPEEVRSLRDANEDGNYARGGQIGLRAVADLGGGLELSNNARFQSYDHGTKFNLGISTFYGAGARNTGLAPTDPFTGVPLNARILVDGDGNDSDFQDEARLTYTLESGATTHRLTVGGFGSFAWFQPVTYSYFYLSNTDPEALDIGFFGGPPSFLAATPPTGAGQSRVDRYTEDVYAVFVGDEIEIGDDLSVNVGARYDWIRIKLNGFYRDRPPTRTGPVPDADQVPVVDRRESFQDFSLSLGANYRFTPRAAVFGNVTRAFRAPDYSAFSAADRGTNNPESQEYIPTIDDNEVIYNGEIGVRTTQRQYGVDATAFYTFIDNRLATVYEGAIAVQKPFGSNQIMGFEVGASATPRAIPGLFARASFTLQDARFSSFEVPIGAADPAGDLYGNEVRQAVDTNGAPVVDGDGNQVLVIDLEGNRVPRVPPVIANLIVNYDAEYFGFNGLVNGLFGGFFDATNIYENPTFFNTNLGAYARVPFGASAVRLGVLVKNALNQNDAYRFLYVSNNADALAQAQRTPAGVADDGSPVLFTGIPQLPRRFLFTLQYEF